LAALFQKDFRNILGLPLEPFWTHLSRIPMYSPIFRRDFQNPPVRSHTWRNLYFAGNYRTFPSIASTGTALRSAIEGTCGDSRRARSQYGSSRDDRLLSSPIDAARRKGEHGVSQPVRVRRSV
jgi:hypothetical protein